MFDCDCSTASLLSPGLKFGVLDEKRPRSSHFRDSAQSCRWLRHHPNFGLLWDRYLPATPTQGRSDTKKAKQWAMGELVKWYAEAVRCAHPESLDAPLRRALQRRSDAAMAAWGEGAVARRTLVTIDRLCAGSGNLSRFESGGLFFNLAFGAPMIPGSSLKGILHHYLEEIWRPAMPGGSEWYQQARPQCVQGSVADQQWRSLLEELGAIEMPERLIDAVTGVGADAGNDSESKAPESNPRRRRRPRTNSSGLFEFGQGLVVFHDAIAAAPKAGATWFDADVLTPHHPMYYRGAQADARDTDEPNPITFLAVAIGTRFDLLLHPSSASRRLGTRTSSRTNAAGYSAHDAHRLLVMFTAERLIEALEDWGAGARTGAGYGRLIPVG